MAAIPLLPACDELDTPVTGSVTHDSVAITIGVTGTVKWFNETKGFGFIAPDDIEHTDVFVHYSAIEGSGVKTLKEGQKVRFDIVRRGRFGAIEAANVQPAESQKVK